MNRWDNNCIFTFWREDLTDAYDQNVYGIITVLFMAGWELIATMILWVFSCNLRRQENQDHFIQNKKQKINDWSKVQFVSIWIPYFI